MENQKNDFLNGPILSPLLRFAGPVLLALFLQAMYGAVDLIVVGKFAGTADISAVSTGSQAMQLVTSLLVGLTTGVTVLLGQKIGEGRPDEAGNVVGSAICLFVCVALALTALLSALTEPFCRLLQAPEEAFVPTTQYVRICSAGTLFIVAFNVIGSVFRGLGDSKMPLITVAIACVTNIFGDLLAGIFANDHAVILEAADYLKAYAIDCLLTSFLFCFVGYFSGLGKTVFVMTQGILGAFGVRIPVSFAMSRLPNVRLFYIGLATPCSTVVQVLLCLGYYAHLARRERRA